MAREWGQRVVVVVPPHVPHMAECSGLPCKCHVAGGDFGSTSEADFGSGLASLHLRRLVAHLGANSTKAKCENLLRAFGARFESRLSGCMGWVHVDQHLHAQQNARRKGRTREANGPGVLRICQRRPDRVVAESSKLVQLPSCGGWTLHRLLGRSPVTL